MFTGKGGVGKTTVAAATALTAARTGGRTLVMSFDLAHSLSDAFDLKRDLFDLHGGLPQTIRDNLDLQEIDVQEELERHWGEIAQYAMLLMSTTGVSDVVAEEMAIIPGMEDVVALLYLNQYIQEQTYDTIVVDCPPTGESLRFVNITATLQWYMRKRFRFDRNLFKLARPIANKVADFNLPDDDYFAAVARLFKRLDGIDEILLDPTMTTVRLVTNPEKMVVRETQRAYMYFNMYGMTTDAVIINRMLTGTTGSLAGWAATHELHAARVKEYFSPIPVLTLPMYSDEIIGIDRLKTLGRELYQEENPTRVYIDAPPYEFSKHGEVYALRIKLPFVDKKNVDLSREADDLIIRVGTFKRYVPLPRRAAQLKVSSVKLGGGELLITFGKE